MTQHFFKATNRLRIADYFTDLKNKIDLLVEIYISDNQHDPARIDEINKVREEWIKEANECQAHDLAELEENEDKDLLIADEQLFKRHCFLIYSHADVKTTGCFTGRFISTDVYLRPGQIECFQELLKFTSSENRYLIDIGYYIYMDKFTKGLNKMFGCVEIYDQYNLYELLHVTNNTINIEQHNLGVIKEPSEALFAFTSAVIGIKIEAIQPDAEFLFTRLAQLTLLAAHEQTSTYLGETILRTVNIFETVSSLHNKLFVELKFRKNDEYHFLPILQEDERCIALGDHIGTARERLDALDMTKVCIESIKELFTSKDEYDREFVCWPRLIQLMYTHDFVWEILSEQDLFVKLVPNLQKLDFGRISIDSLDANVFKHAGKLLELDLDVLKIENSRFANETFYGLTNLRVLNVNTVVLDSVEPFNCLCSLEELTLVVRDKSPISWLDAFLDNFLKLKVLKLEFKSGVESISPTTLICPQQFGLEYLKRYCNSCLEIGIAPRFLKVVGVETLRLLGSESLVANIETIELFQLDSESSRLWHGVQLTTLECDWPLSGLKRLSARPLNEASLSFYQMANLEFLSLKLTDFGVLNRSGLGCLCKLKELQVDFDDKGSQGDTNISDIDCSMFAGLSSLTTLIISGFKQLTRIVSLPATLEHIELSGNCIKTIELDAFSLLGKLKHLNLDKNCLTADKTFPAFAHLFHLEYLSLQDNMIDSLEGLNSICLPRLRVLNLCNGKVKKLSKQMFATLPGLVNLILGNNKITEIEAGAFDGLVNLRVLNLYQNKLKEFYFNVFESAVNKLGAPVNLTDVSLYADLIIETVRWSSETTHAHEYMLIEKENQKSEADAAAGLFAKCGFRNKLDVILRTREITDQSFVNALAAMDLVRWSYH